MGVAYRVYGNGGSGGPIDYSTPLQDSASTTFAYATIPPGDWSFGVRAYDTASGLEERNTDAVVRVVIGADFLDHSAVPNPPLHLTATPRAGGKLKLDFAYVGAGQGGPPGSFAAWLWDGAVDWTAPPTATIPAGWMRGDVARHYSMTISGLADGVGYTVGVRATNAAGDDGNATTLPVTGKAGGPGAVGSLAAAPGYASGG